MNELLNLAIEAHGGLARWREFEAIQVDASITGAIWAVKGRPDVLKNVRFVVDTIRERLMMQFPGQDRRTLFEPSRITIASSNGSLTETRDNPVESFVGQTQDSPWDDFHVAYFSGEALWTYLNTPFLFAQPGFEAKEIAPLRVSGEVWRRLQVVFPESVKSHTHTQIFCFGDDGLLRRHDYTVDVLGGARGLNYASNYRDVDGIMIPLTRRVVAYEGDFQPVWEPVLVEIEMREVKLFRRGVAADPFA